MSTEYKRTTNHHGDQVLVITVTGWHDIFRLSYSLLHAQVEFSAAARDTFRWLRRRLGADAFDRVDQSLTGGKVKPYAMPVRGGL